METTISTLANSLKSLGVPEDYLFQIAYYVPSFDSSRFAEAPAISWIWSRRTEMIRVYPGREPLQQAVFYVANSRAMIAGMEVELIQPLTTPNYIAALRLEPGQVAHLGVKSERFGGDEDISILRRFSRHVPQAIQKGTVRAGKKSSYKYTVYQLDDFLPVKIIRDE